MQLYRKIGNYILLFLTTFVTDRITKWWALTYLQDKQIPIFSGLNFSFSWNRGVSWGMLNHTTSTGFYLLTTLIIAIIFIFALYLIAEYKKNRWVGFEVLVISGALSNVIDRFLYGAVIDFIDIYASTWHWPTFNIADVCIVVGVFGIVGREVLYGYHRKN